MARRHWNRNLPEQRPRFKIDFDDWANRPFALFYRTRRNLLDRMFKRTWWEKLENFETLPEADAYYERIKDLPLYRD